MLVFLKLGGSLITDKSQYETARMEVLERIANEIKWGLESAPSLSLLIGHGSGSFGHSVASKYQTHQGVSSREDWLGFAHVASVAAQLNQLVLDSLRDAGIPIFRVQPSASAVCRDGNIQELATEPIRRALEANLVPLVYGDVAMDIVRGGTIISTEAIFVYLGRQLRPRRILLVGDFEGVRDENQQVLPILTRRELRTHSTALSGSAYTDVTGGMADKVQQMLDLCDTFPGLTVQIFSGNAPDSIRRSLVDPGFSPGTRLSGSTANSAS